jgi:hypothetical protein
MDMAYMAMAVASYQPIRSQFLSSILLPSKPLCYLLNSFWTTLRDRLASALIFCCCFVVKILIMSFYLSLTRWTHCEHCRLGDLMVEQWRWFPIHTQRFQLLQFLLQFSILVAKTFAPFLQELTVHFRLLQLCPTRLYRYYYQFDCVN